MPMPTPTIPDQSQDIFHVLQATFLLFSQETLTDVCHLICKK